jgi:hypothetical protein
MPRSYALSQPHFGNRKRNLDQRPRRLGRNDNGESGKRHNRE